jgi:rfaE bifunctional protein nucleotidyltransferase chain/domain
MISAKIYHDIPTLIKQVDNWKGLGKKIVFTNGCFDILHAGHVFYLEEAKRLGDILIVGVNSNNSVAKLKGPSRPIQDENDRMLILAGLQSVDVVIRFEEETPLTLIEKIIPNFLVKGGDYEIEQIVGKSIVLQNGGQVLTIPFVRNQSTSMILEKINLTTSSF